jgi:sugar phosphate isomerase/epimerase
VIEALDAELAKRGLRAAGLNLHYLSTGLDIEVTFAADARDAELANRVNLADLAARLGARKITVQRLLDTASRSPDQQTARAS